MKRFLTDNAFTCIGIGGWIIFLAYVYVLFRHG